MRRRLSRPFALASVMLAGLMIASAHAAGPSDLRIRVVEAPKAFPSQGRHTLRYVFEVATGRYPERFAVTSSSPSFPREGSLFDGGDLSIAGAGRFAAGNTSQADIGDCGLGNHQTIHGTGGKASKWDVIAPANSRSKITASFETVAGNAPFRGMDLRPRITITPKLSDRSDGPATVPRAFRVRLPKPRRKGPSGVRIRVRTTPTSSDFGTRDAPRYDIGTVLRVRGTTRPRLRHQVIRITELTHLDRARPRLPGRDLHRVRTDGNGRFTYRWRLTTPNHNQLTFRYRRQRGHVTGDRTCPRNVIVRRPR